jgi:hypothetical protein
MKTVVKRVIVLNDSISVYLRYEYDVVFCGDEYSDEYSDGDE